MPDSNHTGPAPENPIQTMFGNSDQSSYSLSSNGSQGPLQSSNSISASPTTPIGANNPTNSFDIAHHARNVLSSYYNQAQNQMGNETTQCCSMTPGAMRSIGGKATYAINSLLYSAKQVLTSSGAMACCGMMSCMQTNACMPLAPFNMLAAGAQCLAKSSNCWLSASVVDENSHIIEKINRNIRNLENYRSSHTGDTIITESVIQLLKSINLLIDARSNKHFTSIVGASSIMLNVSFFILSASIAPQATLPMYYHTFSYAYSAISASIPMCVEGYQRYQRSSANDELQNQTSFNENRDFYSVENNLKILCRTADSNQIVKEIEMLVKNLDEYRHSGFSFNNAKRIAENTFSTIFGCCSTKPESEMSIDKMYRYLFVIFIFTSVLYKKTNYSLKISNQHIKNDLEYALNIVDDLAAQIGISERIEQLLLNNEKDFNSANISLDSDFFLGMLNEIYDMLAPIFE